jgi:hypothetical protein
MDHIFTSVESYRAAGFPENELVMLLYRPESGSIADLEPIRDSCPTTSERLRYRAIRTR